jgi:hypothetical protein
MRQSPERVWVGRASGRSRRMGSGAYSGGDVRVISSMLRRERFHTNLRFAYFNSSLRRLAHEVMVDDRDGSIISTSKQQAPQERAGPVCHVSATAMAIADVNGRQYPGR